MKPRRFFKNPPPSYQKTSIPYPSYLPSRNQDSFNVSQSNAPKAMAEVTERCNVTLQKLSMEMQLVTKHKS